MADIIPFSGLRYNLKKVKRIKNVFAPPYDVISQKEQNQLYSRHDKNIVRLMLGKQYKSDNDKNNRYIRAAVLFNKWIKDKTLIFDRRPCIYVYTQDYIIAGVKKKRIGFIANFNLTDANGCLPHEHTLSKPKEDRIRLIRAVQANLSPIFSFYLDKSKKVEAILWAKINRKPILNFKDEHNIKHSFWKIDDNQTIRQIRRLMKNKVIFIADGHHRYEVACTYRKEMIKQNSPLRKKANYMMMYFTAFSEENLSVLPTHRLVKNINGLEDKVKDIDSYFKRQEFSNLNTLIRAQKNSSGFSLGMYYKKKFFLLKMKNKKLLERLMRKSPAQWRKLDVAMLNKVVFEHIFGLNESQKEEKIGYTRDIDFAVAIVDKKCYDLAFFPNPTKAQQVKQIALSRSKMPQKSTYFYPKPITGLVINKF